MKFEFSAGGIVYRKKQNRKNEILKPASRQGGQVQNDIEILLCQHSKHHGWVFPKGLIGDHKKGESKEETAIREVEEETGIKAKIIKELEPTTYWYVWQGEKRKKTVYYYLMEFIEDTQKRDSEMEAVEWLAIDKVEQRLTYPSDKKIWAEVKKLLQ